MKLVLLLVLVILTAITAPAGTFYSIGTYPSGVPNNFVSIAEDGTTSVLFGLGDGSLGFDGGLTYVTGNNQFYAIANNSQGDSQLVSFSSGGGGLFTTINPALGQGFLSGLAYNSGANLLYTISTDMSGQSTLNSVTLAGVVNTIGTLGIGLYGGLVYNPNDGLLYTVASDLFGIPVLFQSIDPGTAAVADLFPLGDGSVAFDGGLAFKASSSTFYAIGNEWLGNSVLNSFNLGDPGILTPTPLAPLGWGYWNASLVYLETPTIPEAPAFVPLAVLLAGVLVRLRSRQR